MLEYLETLGLKLSVIYNLSNDTRSIQIKSDNELADQTQSVKRMAEKFDEFKK